MLQVAAGNLLARVQRALLRSPIAELREIRVQQPGNSLLLSGVVSSFYHKQLAQEVVRTVCRDFDLGEIEFTNSIRVHD